MYDILSNGYFQFFLVVAVYFIILFFLAGRKILFNIPSEHIIVSEDEIDADKLKEAFRSHPLNKDFDISRISSKTWKISDADNIYIMKKREKNLSICSPSKLDKKNISFFGPFLMWRTKKGREIINHLAKIRKFWNLYADISIVVVIISMILMFLVLLWEATLVPRIPPENAPTPQMILGIPGINPYIPLWYGIIGLAVAMIFHETAHGILTRVAKLKILSLGLLMFIVPVGAFVEPDEEGVTNTTHKKRARLFSVGPGTNIFLAFVFAMIFSWGFMSSVSVPEDGVVIFGIQKDYPAANATIMPWTRIIEINGTHVSNDDDFSAVMAQTHPGQNITMKGYYKGEEKSFNVTLASIDKYTYYSTYYPEQNKDEYKNVGYIGVSVSNPQYLLNTMQGPVRNSHSGMELLGNLFTYGITLPMGGYIPFPNDFRSVFEVHGPMATLGDSFWILAAVMYWIMWINLMIGLTNSLPAVPLDGGYVFRDGLHVLMKKLTPRIKDESRDKIVSATGSFFAYAVLLLIIWQFIGPRILWMFAG